MKKIKKLKSQADRLRDFAKKVTTLEASGDHITFRNQFGKGWSITDDEAKYRHERYHAELQRLAKKHGFLDTELASLELFLQEGGNLVLTRDYDSKEKEDSAYKPTRDWDTIFLARQVAKLRKEGKSYKEIAEYYNRILNSLGIKKRLTTGSLRALMSRANDRLGEKLEDLKVNL